MSGSIREVRKEKEKSRALQTKRINAEYYDGMRGSGYLPEA